MKYKKYHSYIDSGIDWLGEIPEHWEVKTLKYLIAKIIDNRGRTPIIEDTGIPMLEAKHINGTNTYNSNNFDKFISNESYKTFIRDDIEENDILFVTVGTIGKANLVNKNPNFVIAQNIIAFRPNNDINSRFFLNYLRSQEIKEAMNTTNKNSILDSIKISDFIQVRVSIPQIEEQQQIANFLDKATAKIDTLIEKQTKQIELLEEKRQAVISHAVTKGINPNVPMKDSGVEWLGEIPEHWEVSKLRFLFSFSTGLNITKANLIDEDGIPCVNYGEIHSKYGFQVNANKDSLKYVDKEYLITSKTSLLSEGDFVFADTSEDVKGSGNFTHVVGDSKIFAGYHTVIARLINNYNSRFFAYIFDSNIFRTQIQLSIKGVKVFSITQAILKNCSIWFPVIEEQQQIANYLDEKTSKIDILIEKSNKSIELLKEKRTALISAAVTGKIDVREFE